MSNKAPTTPTLFFTDSKGDYAMLLRELLRSYHYTVVETTDSIEVCKEAINTGAARLLIIDDSPTRPSSLTLRELQACAITYLTPTICFTSSHNSNEFEIINQMGSPTIAMKPLTPEKFIPKIKSNAKIWKSGFYPKINQAAKLLLRDQNESGLRLLVELNALHEAKPIVAPALAKFYAELGNIKVAEKILLSALQSHAGSMNIIFALADIYMANAMSFLAYRLLSSAAKRFPKALTIKPDLIHSSVMTDNLSIAIHHLFKMHRADYQRTVVEQMLAKCLYSDGREHEIISSQLHNATEEQLQSSWKKSQKSAS